MMDARLIEDVRRVTIDSPRCKNADMWVTSRTSPYGGPTRLLTWLPCLSRVADKKSYEEDSRLVFSVHCGDKVATRSDLYHEQLPEGHAVAHAIEAVAAQEAPPEMLIDLLCETFPGYAEFLEFFFPG